MKVPSKMTHLRRTLPWLLLILLALVVAISKSRPHESPPPLAQSFLEESSCKGKARCVGAYITPWCPACEGSLPFIHTLQKRFESSPTTGMLLIIGQDDPEKLRAFAKRVGGNSIIDEDGTFAVKNHISGFPTWFVWDESMKVLAQKASGAPGGEFSEEELVKWFFASLLGLDDPLLRGAP